MKITPSPCLMASSETPLRQVVNLLVENKSSYLLLLNNEDILTGIFTKTDLVKISPRFFTEPELGSRPVHLFMNKPVKTLTLEMIHTAPEFMIKNRLEHVPVVELDETTNREKVIGIITSDSIFEYMVRLRGMPLIFGGEAKSKPRRSIGVIGADGSLFRIIKSIFSRSVYVDVERFRFANFELEKAAEGVDALLIDIDDVNNRVWLPIIKDVVKHAGLETVFVAYTPEVHQDVTEMLKKVEVSGVFKLYEKPLDVSSVTVDLEKIWAKVALAD